MTGKLKKCSFFSTTVDYLGHIITPKKLHVATKTTEAIKASQYPTTVSELPSFLGLCNIYRRFVQKFARLASPLNKNLDMVEPLQFGFDNEEMKAADALIDKSITPPVLALSRSTRQHTNHTGACNTRVGCVWLQERNDKILKSVAYRSRPLWDAERRYDTRYKECLAVLWAVHMQIPYLERSHSIKGTDY